MIRKIESGLAILCLLSVALAAAAEERTRLDEKMVIALKTDDFELQETDIGHLGIGDAETIVTDSGKTIDLLRTANGVEVYVDGELLEPGLRDDGAMDAHHEMIHERVESLHLQPGEHEENVIVIRRRVETD